MPSIGDIHKFYEANLDEYQRRDINAVNRFFLELMGRPSKKCIQMVLDNLKEFKDFVAFDYLGLSQIRTKKMEPEPKPKRKPQPTSEIEEKHYGICSCGGAWIKRQNRQKQNFFLGCSRYPTCKNTQPF